MNVYILLDELRTLLLAPAAGWQKISEKEYSWNNIYIYYNIPLVFLSSYVSVINLDMQGMQGMQISLNPNQLFLSLFLGTLISVLLSAYFTAQLAPRFGAVSSFDKSVALLAFSYLPVYLSTLVGSWHQALQIISIAGMIFMVFLFWRGTDVLLKVPENKQTGFVIVTLILLFLTRLVVTSVFSAIFLVASGEVPDQAFPS